MLKRIHVALLALLMVFTAHSTAMADVEYSIENYSMDVFVQPDGSAQITERLLYDFDGEYNGILSQFDTDGIDGIEDFHVFIDEEKMTLVDEMTYISNTYTVTEDGSLAEIRIYSPGEDDVRVVSYEYTMLGLANRYEDTGMILRKFIGENNDVALKNAVVTVYFPEQGDIQAFVHGSMDERHILIREDSVRFGPETIHSGNSVEMRLLFPAEWISDAPLSEGLMLDAALAEEERLVREAAALAVRLRNAKYIFTAAYSLVFFLIWLALTKKYGLKNRLHDTPDPGRLTNYPAAFATVAADDAPDTDALSGTLMELTGKGILRMESQGDDLLFVKQTDDQTGLYPHQKKLIDWLFAAGDALFLSSLNAGDDYRRAQTFETGYGAYCAQVTADMIENKLKYRNSGLIITVNALIILLGLAGAGGILLTGGSEMFLGFIVAAMLCFLLYLMNRIRRLTNEGERLQIDADALRQTDLSASCDLLHFLPYYTALGMTEPLVTAIDAMNADDTATDDSIPVFLYAGWHHSLRTLSASMRETHQHNASIPDPDASSSSHSGGSSNGGGGGHGAW